LGERKGQVQVSYDLTKLLCVLAIYEKPIVNEVLVTFWKKIAPKKTVVYDDKNSHKN
jgi:hypothetical protein